MEAYYTQLSELNVSPDDACYPLGSCTMKYNPYINEWAAGLPGFTRTHPQAPLEDVQGNLELLFEIQEWFKQITGLAGVTTSTGCRGSGGTCRNQAIPSLPPATMDNANATSSSFRAARMEPISRPP